MYSKNRSLININSKSVKQLIKKRIHYIFAIVVMFSISNIKFPSYGLNSDILKNYTLYFFYLTFDIKPMCFPINHTIRMLDIRKRVF